MTTDLLQRIAKCAPKEMGAMFYKGYRTTPDHIQFNNVRWKNPLDKTAWVVELVATDEPCVNSQGCEAMIDAMEKEWYKTKLSNQTILVAPETIADGYRMSALQIVDADQEGNHYEGYGPTRAIAVGEAFCKVFEAR